MSEPDKTPQESIPNQELATIAFWKQHNIYEKSLQKRQGAEKFVFYEGPPTANGLPHPGHCLTRAIKDLYPRYKTMRGFFCERKGGWDTHGLPVEVEVCKEIGIHSKEDIENYGVEPFIHKCMESVFRYTRQWEELTERLGFWINLEEAYVTYHQSYVESVWWSLKNLFDRGLLYQGHKIVWWWAQGGTALSSGEVGQGYRQVADPSVFVRFPLVDRIPGDHWKTFNEELGIAVNTKHNFVGVVDLIVWTTTPWTLPSNQFAAISPKLDYAVVQLTREDGTVDDRLAVIAKDLVETVAAKAKMKAQVLETYSGLELVGLRYDPPFHFYYDKVGKAKGTLKSKLKAYKAWRTVAADFVTLEAGTGIVHQAPAFGEVDFDILQAEQWQFLEGEGPELICCVGPDGKFTSEAIPYEGKWVKDADKEIVKDLRSKSLLFHQEQYLHEYPFCWRAENDPLIQYPRKSWFIRTTQFKDAMLENNAQINWMPEHIKDGRFGNFLESNVDWALSRERYWGTPLPIWVCEQTGQMEAVSSYAELLEKPGVQGPEVWEEAKRANPNLSDDLKVHKPYIDAITYASPFAEGKRMRRVSEVIDCWYDSGAMPFAQWGYPHQSGSEETLKQNFPADFISEAIDQTRGWFYSQLAISTLLFAPLGSQASSLPVEPPSHAQAGSLRSQRSRGYLPHWEAGETAQHVVFRLDDSLPRSFVEQIKQELETITESQQDTEKRKKYEELLDKSLGECWLKLPEIAKIIEDALLHFDGERYKIHAWVVMPNHVHVMFTPKNSYTLSDILHSWKSFTANKANKILNRSGSFWGVEYFDRMIRDEKHFLAAWEYIEMNPVKAGLCGSPEEWRYGSAGTAGISPATGDADFQLRAGKMPAFPGVPFRNCIVLGLMLGEDGQKMSKQKRNYREPNEIFSKYGADALRWYFFANQTPWTSIRYSEQAIKDSMPEFLLRLSNVVSFFDVYRKIDKFDPNSPNRPQADTDRTELDRWILSELHLTNKVVVEKMDQYDHFAACAQLTEFVDSLSNWYVRRSRDRFWSSTDASPEERQSKTDAYFTLYECLLRTTKLIAPFVPFLAERVWAELVDTMLQEESVHLCDYPIVDESQIDEPLSRRMKTMREIVSLGRNARMGAKLKVRQPLAQVEIVLVDRSELGWLSQHAELIAEELNVKSVKFIEKADQYITYTVLPDFKVLGKKLGKLLPEVKKILGESDGAKLLAEMERNGKVVLSTSETPVELTADEIQIRLQAKDGWAAAQGHGCVVVLSTELTDELLAEGRARELVRLIQDRRKEMNCEYTDRITVEIATTSRLLQDAIQKFGNYIRGETLCTSLKQVPQTDTVSEPLKVDGESLQLRVDVVS
ncbi:MAG: class I tRNA ligase family protein [Planctomycetaceae bacterium]|nr:class I tRNA ligase family protein [Planctomycetaceae bacterium]